MRCAVKCATKRTGKRTGKRAGRGVQPPLSQGRSRLPHIAALLALIAASAGMAAVFVSDARAHELRPAYLDLTGTGDDAGAEGESWAGIWKVPVRAGKVLAVTPRFPADCTITPATARSREAGALTTRFTLTCARPLAGRDIHFSGLEATLTDVLVRVALPGERAGAGASARATPGAPAITVPAVPTRWGSARSYFVLGVEHILTGFDHLLFVAALVLLIGGVRRLVETVTAFTVAHSLTLAGVTLGWMSLPPAPVEAVIALSIVYLAREVALAHGHAGLPAHALSARAPWLIAFAFGLLHGFGFAGALAEIGLPEGAMGLALFSFNLGVEAGQLVFVALLLAALQVLARLDLRRHVAMPGSYAIGALASFWLIERLV